MAYFNPSFFAVLQLETAQVDAITAYQRVKQISLTSLESLPLVITAMVLKVFANVGFTGPVLASPTLRSILYVTLIKDLFT